MEKNLVLYYSKTGSNRFLAEKIGEKLGCGVVEVKPRFNSFLYIALSTVFNRGFGVKRLDIDLNDYSRLIICSPIWFGKVLSPISDLISKYKAVIPRVFFASCCGSSDDKKDEKFGYSSTHNQLKELLGEKLINFEAFPIGLVIPQDKLNDDKAMMNTRLSEDTINSSVEKRLDNFIMTL